PPPASSTLSLHDALPISRGAHAPRAEPSRRVAPAEERRRAGAPIRHPRAPWGRGGEPAAVLRARLGPAGLPPYGATASVGPRRRSEEHTSELQSRRDLVC